MMTILFFSGLTILYVMGSGLGITALLLPSYLQTALLPISFWVGVIWIALLGTILSQMGIPTGQSWMLIAALSLALLLIAYQKQKMRIHITRSGILVVILTGLALGVHLFTYLTKASQLTTISMGNLDPISYSTVADYLQTKTVWEGAVYQPFSPYLWSVGDLLHSSYRWGTPMVLSVLSATFGMRAYQLFGILITVFFVMSYPMLWTLLKQMRPKASLMEASVLFLVYAINSTLMYTLYNVFFAQFAWGGILILGVYLAQTKNTAWLTGLVVAGTALIYPEGIIFILLPMLILRQWKSLGLALLLAPYPLLTSLRQLISVMISSSKVTWIGWEHLRYPNLLEILGLYNLNYSRPLPFYLLLLPSLTLLAVMTGGLIKAKNRRVLCTYFGVFGLAYLATLAGGNWFTYFRAITYSIFLYAAVFVVGTGDLLSRVSRKYMVLAVIVIATLAIRSSVRTAKQMYYHHQTVDQAVISLSQVQNDHGLLATADLFLGEYNLWTRLWREYLLMGKPLITRQNWTTDREKLGTIQQVLVEKDKVSELSQKINLSTKVWENEYYAIYAVDIQADQI